MALGAHPAGMLLDYEQYIEHQIRCTRSRIKETDVLAAGLIPDAGALGGVSHGRGSPRDRIDIRLDYPAFW